MVFWALLRPPEGSGERSEPFLLGFVGLALLQSRLKDQQMEKGTGRLKAHKKAARSDGFFGFVKPPSKVWRAQRAIPVLSNNF